MTGLNGRLNKLENEAEIRIPKLPFLFLFQSLHDDDLYQGRDPYRPDGKTGKQYHREEFAELGNNYQLILINYAKDWRALVG